MLLCDSLVLSSGYDGFRRSISVRWAFLPIRLSILAVFGGRGHTHTIRSLDFLAKTMEWDIWLFFAQRVNTIVTCFMSSSSVRATD